jgi:hypothetical protein
VRHGSATAPPDTEVERDGVFFSTGRRQRPLGVQLILHGGIELPKRLGTGGTQRLRNLISSSAAGLEVPSQPFDVHQRESTASSPATLGYGGENP